MQLFAVEEDMSGLVGLVFVQKVGPVALFGSCQGITWDLCGPQYDFGGIFQNLGLGEEGWPATVVWKLIGNCLGCVWA